MSSPVQRPISGGHGQEPPGGDLPAEERRAPTAAEWAEMTPEQRLRVEEELLTSDSQEQEALRQEAMAEGERHLNTKVLRRRQNEGEEPSMRPAL